MVTSKKNNTNCILLTQDESGKPIRFNMPVEALRFDTCRNNSKCHQRIALKVKGLCAEVMVFDISNTLDQR